MKRILAALLAALMAAAMSTALAEERVDVYVADGCMPRERAQQIVQLLEQEFEGVRFALTGEERALNALIFADRAPQIALCSPQEAAMWVREGLLLPLDGCMAQEPEIARAVLAACRWKGRLVMAPLYARNRQMAVNRALLEKAGLGSLLNAREYPAWLPMQLVQVLDEFALEGEAALELWLPSQGESGAVVSFVQSLYGGLMISEDGLTVLPSRDAMAAGLSFVEDMIEAGMIARAESRADALARFMAGETALFVDWTGEEAAAYLEKAPFELMTVPYPASSGMPAHAADLVGAIAFASGDRARDALSTEAIAFLMRDPRAQLLLGERGIFEDGAAFILPPGADERLFRLHSVLCSVLDALLCREMDADAAMMILAACAAGGAR